MYDRANSAFATTTMAAVLPVFYSAVASEGALTPVQASSNWGLTQTLGMLFVAVAAPALGAIADFSGSKKRFLAGVLFSYVVYNALTIPIIGIVAPRLGISNGPMAVGLVLTNQIPAFLLSRLLGPRVMAGPASRMNTKNAILLGLALYTLVVIWGFFMRTAAEFWWLAIMVGLVQGGSQTLSRSLFGNMVPKAQTAEFYGSTP
jgi:MFS-type transporter involved in bile tolerance (Atg22 family)